MGDGTGSSGANAGNNPGSGGMSTPGPGAGNSSGAGAGAASGAAGAAAAAKGAADAGAAAKAGATASAAKAAKASEAKSTTAKTGNMGSGASTSAGAAAAAAKSAAAKAAATSSNSNKGNASPGAGAGAAAAAAKAAAAGGLAKAAAAQGANLGVGQSSGAMAKAGLAGPNAAAGAAMRAATAAGVAKNNAEREAAGYSAVSGGIPSSAKAAAAKGFAGPGFGTLGDPNKGAAPAATAAKSAAPAGLTSNLATQAASFMNRDTSKDYADPGVRGFGAFMSDNQMIGPSNLTQDQKDRAHLVAATARQMGINPQEAVKIANLESARFKSMNDKEGDIVGTMQVGTPAFKDMAPTMPASARKQTNANIMAGLAYAMQQANTLTKKGLTPTTTNVYGMYNQGPAFANVLRNPSQSAVQSLIGAGVRPGIATRNVRGNSFGLSKDAASVAARTGAQMTSAMEGKLGSLAEASGLNMGAPTSTPSAPSSPQASTPDSRVAEQAARTAMQQAGAQQQAQSGAAQRAASLSAMGQRGLLGGSVMGAPSFGYSDQRTPGDPSTAARNAPGFSPGLNTPMNAATAATQVSKAGPVAVGKSNMGMFGQPGQPMGPQAGLNPGTPGAMDTGRAIAGMLSGALNPGTPNQMNAPSAPATGLTSAYTDAGMRNPAVPGIQGPPTSTPKSDMGLFGQQSGTTSQAMAAAAQQQRMASMDAQRMAAQVQQHQQQERATMEAFSQGIGLGSFTNQAMAAENQPTSAFGTGSFKNRAMTRANQPKAGEFGSFPARGMIASNQPGGVAPGPAGALPATNIGYTDPGMAPRNPAETMISQTRLGEPSVPTVSHPPNPRVGTPTVAQPMTAERPKLGLVPGQLPSFANDTPLPNMQPGQFSTADPKKQKNEIGDVDKALQAIAGKLGMSYSSFKDGLANSFLGKRQMAAADVESVQQNKEGGWTISMKSGAVINTKPDGSFVGTHMGMTVTGSLKDSRVKASISGETPGVAGFPSAEALDQATAGLFSQTKPSAPAPAAPSRPTPSFGPRFGTPFGPTPSAPAPSPAPAAPGPAPSPAPAAPGPAPAPSVTSPAMPPSRMDTPSHFGPPTRPNQNGFPSTSMNPAIGGGPMASGVNTSGMKDPVFQSFMQGIGMVPPNASGPELTAEEFLALLLEQQEQPTEPPAITPTAV